MATRTYSDPSYGAKKMMRFGTAYTCGTRSAATLESIPMMHKFKITDAVMKCIAAGSGSTSAWAVVAGTTAICTMTFATNCTAATVVNGTITAYEAGKDTLLHLYSGTQTADPAQTVVVWVEYEELFDNDND